MVIGQSQAHTPLSGTAGPTTHQLIYELAVRSHVGGVRMEFTLPAMPIRALDSFPTLPTAEILFHILSLE